MKARTLLTSLGLLTLASVQAQVSPGIGIRGGYYFGDRFDSLTTGERADLHGFELGADIRLYKKELMEIQFSPTVVFGGIAQGGADFDGFIYRAMVGAKLKNPDQPWYTVVGAGWAAIENRDTKQFKTTSDIIGQFSIGYDADTKFGRAKVYYEIGYFFGESRLSGLSFDIGLRF